MKVIDGPVLVNSHMLPPENATTFNDYRTDVFSRKAKEKHEVKVLVDGSYQTVPYQEIGAVGTKIT